MPDLMCFMLCSSMTCVRVKTMKLSYRYVVTFIFLDILKFFVNMQDLDFSTVKDMVKFIYSGRLADIAEKSDLLLSAADKYDIKDLKDICCQCLSSNLNVEQV